MAATRTQRVGIWIIALFMAIGTIGSFAIIVLANDNNQKDQSRYNELLAEYQADYAAHKDGMSKKYYPKLKEFESRVMPFDKEGITELQMVDLAEGTGEVLQKSASFTAYYIGWNASGKVFDSSFNEGEESLKDPFDTSFGVIEGWSLGVEGMKEGGVRELTIPADLAYGEQERENIPANSPLKFVIIVVPVSELASAPQASEELINLSQRIYGY